MLRLAAVLAATTAVSSLAAQSSACHDFSTVDGIVEDMVRTTARRGACVLVHRSGTDLYARSYGSYSLDEVVAIASATKWLSGAVIMSLVDDGLLDLDAPASTWLPNYTGDHGRMTVRQMFSHTAGMLGQHPAISDDSITLAQAVDILANVPLRTTPGTDFFYGGVSMHVAGRIAEIAGGKPWAQLFAERVAQPLGMTSTDFLGLGTTQNPRIAGGARSTLRDYGNFLVMLRQGGVFDGRRVLSAAAVETMLQDQTNGVPITSTPQPDGRRYGVGCWTDRVDAANATRRASSQGAFGFSPWYDRERDTVGIVLVESLLRRVRPYVDAVQDWTDENLRFVGVDCYGPSTPACAAPIRGFSNELPAAGNAAFALTCRDAPSSATGVLLVGVADRAPAGPFLGIQRLVAATPPTASVTAFSDGQGLASVPLPLTPIPPSTKAFAQWFWLDPAGCGPTQLRASHGIELTVQ